MAGPLWIKDKLYIDRQLREELATTARSSTPSITSRRGPGAFPPPFEDAAILTMDGVGEWRRPRSGTAGATTSRSRLTSCTTADLGLLYLRLSPTTPASRSTRASTR
ncbi:MAG: hypothetical protein R2712_22920 [Vicinamibacterales bacterium]